MADVIENPPPVPAPPSIPIQSVAVTLPSNFGGNLTDETIYVQGIIVATSQIDASASITNTQVNAQAALYRAELDYAASVYGTAKSAEAQKYNADRQLEAVNNQLTMFNPVEASLRVQEIQARQYAADQSRIAQITAATTGAAADLQAATTRATADLQVATTRAQADQAIAQVDYQGRVQTAQMNKDAQVFSAQQDLAGRQYSADKSYSGQVYEADQSYATTQLHEQAETGRLQTKLNYATDKFNLVYPFVAQSLQAALGQTGVVTPGLDPTWPYVATRGVFTPAQVQQQVNQAYARNDSRAQAQLRQLQGELAGRGFSSNSPLFDVIRVGVLGQTLRANNDAATGIRLGAAQANAEQTLKAQELAVNEFQAKQQVALESEKNQITRQVGFVGALAQLIGGIT